MSTNTALALTPPVISTLAKQFDYTEDFVETVKNTFTKGATDDELRLLLFTAKRTGLDLFARQIFCVKRYDSKTKTEVMSVQVSIDGYRLIADRTGQYVPSREPSYAFDGSGNLESATAHIKKLVAGSWHEISATAFFSEYVQTTRDGGANSMWRKMPRLMLSKCAESLVLRKAFPAELSGIYTVEEMASISDDAPTDYDAPAQPKQIESVQVLTAEESEAAAAHDEKLRAEIVDLSKALGKNPTQTIAYFDANSDMRQRCHGKVLAAARDVVKTAVTSDDWAYEPDGTTKFLAGFGIEGIETAEADALVLCVNGLADLGMLRFLG